MRDEARKLIESIIYKRRAYRRVFMDGDKLSRDAEIVLADLMKFCRYHQSITVVSPISRTTDVPASFQAEGRREVMARILDQLHADDADLIKLERTSND
jgi:hypothetical protein